MRLLQLVTLVATLVAVDTAANAQIFETNFDQNTLGEYDLNGTPINPTLISNLNEPMDVVIDGQYLYVSNWGDGTIGKYTLSGTPVNTHLISGLVNPAGIVISGTNLFVADYAAKRVSEYTTSGVLVNPTFITGLNTPFGLAISGDNIFVSDWANETLGEYKLDGTPVNTNLIPGLRTPAGLTISGNDLYVASPIGQYIGKYATDGTPIDPKLISDDQQILLYYPYATAVLGSTLYVANFNPFEPGSIGKFTTSGAEINSQLITGLGNVTGIAVLPEPSTYGLAMVAGGSLLALRLSRRKLVRH